MYAYKLSTSLLCSFLQARVQSEFIFKLFFCQTFFYETKPRYKPRYKYICEHCLKIFSSFSHVYDIIYTDK